MDKPLRVGMLRNGGTPFAGPATIDLGYLLGENGGHLNANGIAGLGAKTSFILHVNYLLLHEAARHIKSLGISHPERLQIVPVIFNVKGHDLFFIDHWGKRWEEKKAEALPEWRDYLGVSDPTPFQGVKFYAPQVKAQETAANVGRNDDEVKPYSWSLSDIIEQRLFKFLFSEEDIYDANFGGLVGELEERLTDESSGAPQLNTQGGDTANFAKLLHWFRDNRTTFVESAPGTRGKLLRRLKYIVQEGDGVLRREDGKGHPLIIPNTSAAGPVVIDLFEIRLTPSLQRFVVAAVFQQLIQNRSGTKAIEGLRYLVTLDELNRFAPKAGSDPITQMIEVVAGEMRSQGVILLGAQQQASLVKPRVFENAAIKAVGRSGSLELAAEVWKFLGPTGRNQAEQAQAEEKLLIQPSFRRPMLAKIPYPPWALKKEDAASLYARGDASGSTPPARRKPQVEAGFA
jgi:hypothetical protein